MNRFLMFLFLLTGSTSLLWAGQPGNPPENISAPAKALPKALSLGPIKNRPVIEGCVCEFQQPNTRVKGLPDAVFISAIGWDQAWIHVGQDDVSLKKDSTPSKIVDRKGEKVKAQFSGPSELSADLDLPVENVSPASEPCDTIGLEGTLNVMRGDQKATTRVTGSCGC